MLGVVVGGVGAAGDVEAPDCPDEAVSIVLCVACDELLAVESCLSSCASGLGAFFAATTAFFGAFVELK